MGYSPLMHTITRTWQGAREFQCIALPAPLQRMFDAFRMLPLVQVMRESGVPEGPWRAGIPLFGNPLITHVNDVGECISIGGRTLLALWQHARMLSVGHALLYHSAVLSPPNGQHRSTLLHALLSRAASAAGGAGAIAEALADTVARVPACLLPPINWEAQGHTSTPHEAASRLLGVLGWPSPSGGRPIFIANLTVKMATALQLGPVHLERQRRHDAFLLLATGHPAQPEDRAELRRLLKTLWHIKWSNFVKEVFWRLVLNGLATSERLHQATDVCPCGAAVPGCAHHMWECPVMQHLMAVVADAIPTHPVLSRSNVWLMRAPQGVLPAVWRIVCLAALQAAWWSRTTLMAPGHWQPTFMGTAQQQMQLARDRIVSNFLELLQNFADSGHCPPSWRQQLPRGSPFLHFHHPAGRLRVNCHIQQGV